jgi:serine/threonine-protein kinase
MGAAFERAYTRTSVALAPDGRHVVYVAPGGASVQLHLRALDRLDPASIAGTDGAANPFFSPDGAWVGFWANGALKKVALAGGPPVELCRTALIVGASWGSDDRIVFARESSGLWRVPAAGGAPEELTKAEAANGEVSHRLPQVLPGGKAVLFTILWTFFVWNDAQSVVQSLENGQRRVLVEGASDARYASSGHVVCARMGVLQAIPFDLQRLETTGGAVSIVDNVLHAVNLGNTSSDSGAAGYALSSTGTLLYLSGAVRPEPVLDAG